MKRQTDFLLATIFLSGVLILTGCKKEDPPKVATNPVSDVELSTAKAGGIITDDGGTEVIARGVVWNVTTKPTTSNFLTSDGTGMGEYTSQITGINEGTTYYVRAYATNSKGTSYGEEYSFTTLSSSPATVTTSPVADVTLTSATAGGNVTNDGLASVTARGVCWNTATNPTIENNKTTDGTGVGAFSSSLTDLQEGTTYYVRAYATNRKGTSYGEEISFTSLSSSSATVTTSPVADITFTSATTGGNVTNDGLSSVTARGVCWNTATNPTIENNKTTDGTGVGAFSSSLTGLQGGTTYYIRAYATNSKGTAYGNEVTFTTIAAAEATVTTTAITNITLNTAISGGNVTNQGQADVTTRGVCWSTTAHPTIESSKTTDGTGVGEYLSNLTGLLEGTTYFVRAYATNSKGTSYGNEVTFTTMAKTLATVTTTTASAITYTSALSGGNITNDGLSNITARGVCWSTIPLPTIDNAKTVNGTGKGEFSSSLTGLLEGTTYHMRAYATNSKGTAYGNEITFSTPGTAIATLSTTKISGLTPTTAITGGNISTDGGAAVTARGVCWGTTANPTITDNKTTNGTGTGIFVSNLTGLSAGTVYHIRAYATNSKGTAYGNDITLVTSIADVDGNVYKAVLIGNQIWMAENLRTTRYNDNTPITNVSDSLAWMTLTTPAYAWYRNRETNKQWGALYNWYTVNTGNLCPQGWHAPTNAEFMTMEKAVGIPADSVGRWGWRGTGVGNKLKDSIAWGAGNGNNSTGFTAMPSGYRAYINSEFRGLNVISYYWTATDDAVNLKPDVAWYRRLDATVGWIYMATTGKAGGKSVRCLKNP